MYSLVTNLTAAEVAERTTRVYGRSGTYFNVKLPTLDPLEGTDKLLEVGAIFECPDGKYILADDGSLRPYQ